MAETMAELNKGEGMSNKLRATVTNSGNQTRAQILNGIYTALKTAYDEDNTVMFTARILFKYSSGDTYALSGQGYISSTQTFSFLSQAVNGAGDTIMLNTVSIATSNSKSLYCRTTVGSNWNNLTDVSNNTDLASIELYY